MQNEQSEYTDVPEKGLFFVPLGGVGEIGINFGLYACDGKWIAVDCGVGFAGDRLPGVDMVLPDPSFAEKISKNLKALIITHAHEDHIGAVGHFWPLLRCPVYVTPFAAEMLETRLDEAGILGRVPVEVVEAGDVGIVEGNVAVFSDAHADDVAGVFSEQSGVARALCGGVGTGRVDVMDAAEGDEAEEAVAQKIAESLRRVAVEADVFVHVEGVNAGEIHRAGPARFGKGGQNGSVLLYFKADSDLTLTSDASLEILHASRKGGEYTTLTKMGIDKETKAGAFQDFVLPPSFKGWLKAKIATADSAAAGTVSIWAEYAAR